MDRGIGGGSVDEEDPLMDKEAVAVRARHTGNWQGSFQGWLETTKTLRMRMSKTLPGLKNFCIAGQWVKPSGSLPTAIMAGRNVAQHIYKRDRSGL